MTLRIGLLGASRIAPEAVMAPVKVIPSAQVTAVAARDGGRAEAFAEAHGIPTALASYEALLERDDVDLVYNALPVSHHARWSLAALRAGKHVLCEKPFAMNATEAEAVLNVANASGRRVIEAFHYRHHPAFSTLLAWLDEGLIGELKTISAEFSAPVPIDGQDIRSFPELGGGAMMDLGCYPLHWVDEISGGTAKVRSATAELADTGVDRSFELSLSLAGGAEAQVRCAMGEGTPIRVQLSIEGSEGTLRFVNPLAPHRGARLELKGRDMRTAAISPLSTYGYQLADLVEALGSGRESYHEGDRILRQQQLLDASFDAAGLAHLRRSTQPLES